MQLIKLTKLKLCFFFLFVMVQSSFGQKTKSPLEQSITITAKKEKLPQFLKRIEKQTKLNFVYNPNDLKEMDVVSLSLNEVKLSNLLTILFDDSKIEFRAKKDQIILYKTNVRKTTFHESENKIEKRVEEKATLSGYLHDAETGEVLIAAYVYDKETLVATTTNNFGFFSLTLPEGEHNIMFTFLGYDSKELKINKTQQVKIELQANSSALTEVTVTASDEKEKEEDPVQSSQIGLMRIAASKLKDIPAFGGEQDVLKAVTLLPGVKQGAAGTAGFYVRGGGPDQNLILMDGVPMYNPYHLWGYLSTFNPDAINNIELTKGAFPARYGGRLSSVLDITMKDGNNQEWEKNVTLGLLSAKASISGPIIKDKSSLFVSARRTVLDLIISPIAAERGRGAVDRNDYNFGDANVKFNYKFSNKDRVYLSGFYSRDAQELISRFKDEDKLKESFKDSRGWRNAFGSARWNHLFNDKLFLNTTAYYSNYHYFSNKREEIISEIESLPSSISDSRYSSDINDLAIKQDYHWFANNQHEIRFGGSAIMHTFKPGIKTLKEETGKLTQSFESPDNTTKATSFSLYAEDDISLGKHLKINLGVHGNAFAVQDTAYYTLQPRLSARILINDNLSFKLGYAQMNQNLHLLTSGSLTSDTDLWVPVTKRITPPRSTQYSIGSAINFGKNYGLEIEGYYKQMSNLIEYKDGASFLNTTEGWEDKVVSGDGESYGLEFFLQKKKGKLTGWLGYSLSWTNRQFEAINFNQPFPYKYDRRHDISIVGNYQLDSKWELNATWVLFSGNHVSLATASLISPDYTGQQNHSWWKFLNEQEYFFDITGKNPGIIQNISSRNNFQLPTYHRMDITATRKWTTKKRGNEMELIFGLTNAYNKFNPDTFSQSYKVVEGVDGQELEINYEQHTRFPILPTVSYSFSF